MFKIFTLSRLLWSLAILLFLTTSVQAIEIKGVRFSEQHVVDQEELMLTGALLLAGPALSLPNMLVIRTILGTEKTVVYCSLVVVMATATGYVYGNVWSP